MQGIDTTPYTTYLLKSLKEQRLLDKNKQVAERCNLALEKMGFKPTPLQYTVGGMLPMGQGAVAVTSRTVTRWKQGVLPVGPHFEAVRQALKMTKEAYVAAYEQYQYKRLVKYGADVEKGLSYEGDLIPCRLLHRILGRLYVVYGVSAEFDSKDKRAYQPSPRKLDELLDDVAAQFAAEGKTLTEEHVDWIRRAGAYEDKVGGLVGRGRIVLPEMVRFAKGESAEGEAEGGEAKGE